jgi:alpha-amylase/alpha-mannosidase (GH57 family)
MAREILGRSPTTGRLRVSPQGGIIVRLMAVASSSPSLERCICIHGHFYQPPRENPWTGKIERQQGPEPYHDWNEKIAAECYTPNAQARILDGSGRLYQYVNNYARISFNFGPTLLRWMEKAVPATYQAILAADRAGRRRLSGHGPAIAQAYHHSILPLANSRDRVTEVVWGLRDFEHRFGRRAEGMWLPEAAVDLETLDILAEHGLRFTILSPFQAVRVRLREGDPGVDVSGGSVDPRQPYRVRLKSGREIVVFFYYAEVAKSVAFERLLYNGESLAARLMAGFSQDPEPQLVHIATDGETYGHHHQFGEMALAYAVRTIDRSEGYRMTVYGEYLERHPPQWTAEIRENSSWSCAHGVERWRSDCGCQTGSRPGWNQAWRGPLRDSLNWLRDRAAAGFEQAAERLLKDPWAARDDYIEVLLDPSFLGRQRFLDRWQRRELSREEVERVWQLMELQRYSLMMFTSCGWFFSDLAGIETIQILRYAARVVELYEQLVGKSVRAPFLRRLAAARSNLVEEGTGKDIFLCRVLAGKQEGARKA